jgi:3-deoxy-D-manno-octulosonic-acid transferase
VTTSLPGPLRAYGAAARAMTPLSPLILAWRRAKGKEDGARIAERRGFSRLARPDGRLVWLHGASVGETVTVLPLASRLIELGVNVLLTSGTVTSATVARDRLPPGALHQFMPLDMPRYVERFLDHWRPDAAIFAESELWPTTLVEAARRGIPLVLVNGRMSQRSFSRWQRVPRSIGALLSRFDLCLTQSDADAQRFSALGARRVEVAGNLKFDAPPPPAADQDVSAMRSLVGDRPVWIAASTHPGEEPVVTAAHASLKASLPGLLTIIIPRHPDRGERIGEAIAVAGLTVARRRTGALPAAATDIYVADTIGELGLFYRLSGIVLVGGSMVPRGGQNPIEPAKLGNAILHGPHVDNFKLAYAGLDEAGGAQCVVGEAELILAVRRLLDDPRRVEDMARANERAVAALEGALDRTLAALEPLVGPAAPGRA